MKRDLERELIRWKESRERKPLILRGMRQVGKTWLVRELGAGHFKSFVEVNFEQTPDLKSCFKKADPFEIIKLLHLNLGKEIIPGSTLLFLDEIQDCPQAILSLRYFFEQLPDLHVIGAVSLLEFTFQSDDFRMPVGRIDFLYLHPLSFGEYLEASGLADLRAYCMRVNPGDPVDDALEQKLNSLVSEYCLCGGMPRAAHAMIDNHDLAQMDREQISIIQTYRQDFGKYAKKVSSELMEKVFANAPGMVGKKYKYSEADEHHRAADVKKALIAMEKAGIIHRIFSTSGAGLPLAMHKRENVFKTVFADIGLMQRMLGISKEIYNSKDLLDVYRGAVAEQYVGQQLLALFPPYAHRELYYWQREKRNSQAEVDYLWQYNSQIIPVEVKSGTAGRLKSVQRFFQEYHSPLAVRISRRPHSFQDAILSIPFWGIEGMDRILSSLLK